MGHIVVSGHVCVDILPALPAEIAMQPGDLTEIGPAAMTIGGCVGNTGGDLADLGVSVRLVATVADDQLGAVVRNVFRSRGLATDGLAVTQRAATSYSLVLEPGGADRTLWHHPGANGEFDGTGVELDGAALLHLGYPPLLGRMLTENGLPISRLFGRARDAGVTTSLDLAVVDPRSEVAALDWRAIFAAVLPLVDVFTPSFDDLRSVLGFTEGFSAEFAERLAEDFIAAGVAVVAISAGAAGMYLRTAGSKRLSAGGAVLAGLSATWADRRLWQAPMLVAEAVTTNGAGDAATAGLLYGLWLALSPDETARLAGACAAALIAGRPTTRDAVASIDPELAARIARVAPPSTE